MCRSKSSTTFGNMDNPRVMRGASWRNNHFVTRLGPFDPSLVSEGCLSQKSLKTKLKDMLSDMPLKSAFPFLETSSSRVVKSSVKQLRNTGMKLWCRAASEDMNKRLRRAWLGSEGSRYAQTR